MRSSNQLLLAFSFALITLSSCNDEEPTTTVSYTVPEIYAFQNVDFSGQTTRISQLEEMMEYEKESRLEQLKTWSFGKFSGEIISKEKHGDYIEWFLNQPPNPKYPHEPNFIQHLKNVLSEKESTQTNDGKLF